MSKGSLSGPQQISPISPTPGKYWCEIFVDEGSKVRHTGFCFQNSNHKFLWDWINPSKNSPPTYRHLPESTDKYKYSCCMSVTLTQETINLTTEMEVDNYVAGNYDCRTAMGLFLQHLRRVGGAHSNDIDECEKCLQQIRSQDIDAAKALMIVATGGTVAIAQHHPKVVGLGLLLGFFLWRYEVINFEPFQLLFESS